MPVGFVKKALAVLGLDDAEYEDYDDYDPRPAVGRHAGRPVHDEVDVPTQAVPAASAATIRPLAREEGPVALATVPPRQVTRAAVEAAKVHVAAPSQFADARQIADVLMGNQAVIVNLQVAAPELMRRMIDFCSGVAYALNGKMERVADKVYLVTPSNVQVSAEERQRLQENGLLRP